MKLIPPEIPTVLPLTAEYDGLAVMAFAVGQNLAYVATLHGIVAVLVHQLVGFFHPVLVIDCG